MHNGNVELIRLITDDFYPKNVCNNALNSQSSNNYVNFEIVQIAYTSLTLFDGVVYCVTE